MFAIMGATGQTGGAALSALLRRGAPVRAITRDAARASRLAPNGVEVVQADATDTASLAAAFTGAEAVYVLNVPRPDASSVFAEGKAVSKSIAEAVRSAKVARVVALSSQGAHRAEGNGIIRVLHDFESALRGAAPSITFIRPTEFIESWGSMLEVARAEGVLPSMRQPIDAKGEMVSAVDVGTTAAEALSDGRNGARIVNLVGPDGYSPRDVAAVMSELVGRHVEAIAPPRDSWVPSLMDAGLGAGYATELANMYEAVNAARVTFEPGVGELRRGSTTLAQALRAIADR